MKPLKHILLIMFMFLGIKTWAQQVVLVQPSDKLELEADSYRGEIQWESSIDNESWSPIDGGTISPFEVTVNALPIYYRARIDEEGCESPHYSEVIEVLSSEDTKLWSDPTTWDGTLPLAGEDVVIDSHVILDVSTPALGELVINGQLSFDRKDLHLSAENIVVNGVLRIGTVGEPFEQEAIITLTGNDNSDGGSDRGIMVPGILELHGATPEVLWTRINQHVEAGSTNVELEEPVEWAPGGEVVLAPTDYYRAGLAQEAITQRVALTAVADNMLTIAEGSNSQRWGLLQYATLTGLSLDPSAQRVEPPFENSISSFTPTVLDERAEVGYLKRNIIIESPDDDLWNSVGFGVHIMIMPMGQAHVDGIQINRGGQLSHVRRYPFHWHNLSYEGLTEIGDALGQYFRNSVINESSQRGVVIHGTNGLHIENNIIYNVQGHGIFLEDAVERRNVIERNLVLMIRNPPGNTQLKNHEQDLNGDSGSSAFWITNPDNIITNNAAADCAGFGYWLAFTTQPWGDRIGFKHPAGHVYRPDREKFRVFENNVAHSVKFRGIMLDLVQADEEGNLKGSQYYSTSNGLDPSYPYPHLERFTLSECTIYKTAHNAFWDRSTWPNTFGFAVADNCGRSFAGAGAEGIIERCLVVGTSLNHEMNDTGRDVLGWTDFYREPNGMTNPGEVPVAFASYHHTFITRDNVVIEFPLVPGKRSGTFDLGDYYIRGFEKGHLRNKGNLLINSHPGYKASSPDPWYTFSSAVWDPHGVWGEEGRYLVDDHPFLTHGKTVVVLDPSSEAVGAVSVEGPFYSIRGFVLYGVGENLPQNQPYSDFWPIHVRRLSNTLTEDATWSVTASTKDDLFGHMKDAVLSPDGIYELTFPGQDAPRDFSMLVDNMMETSDLQVIGVQFDRDVTNVYVGMEAYGNAEYYEAVNSLDEVRNSQGATYWRDPNNDLLWVKLRGGIWQYYATTFEEDPPPTFEDITYEQLTFFIRPQ